MVLFAHSYSLVVRDLCSQFSISVTSLASGSPFPSESLARDLEDLEYSEHYSLS